MPIRMTGMVSGLDTDSIVKCEDSTLIPWHLLFLVGIRL